MRVLCLLIGAVCLSCLGCKSIQEDEDFARAAANARGITSRVAAAGTKQLGLEYTSYSEGTGAYVISVVPGSAADNAGLYSGCVIMSFDGVPILDIDVIQVAKNKRQSGDSVEIIWMDPAGQSWKNTVMLP